MANFPALKMTAAGIEIQAKAQTGQLLKFTRVALGDGNFEGSPAALTALVSEKQSLSIRDQVVPGDGTAILNVIATNAGVSSGFYMREVGSFVEDPDTGVEVLYSYSNAGAECDFLPAEGGSVTWEGLFDLITVVGNAENVTAVIDDYITIALKSEVEALRPYTLPTGGAVGQMLRKGSNAEGDTEWFSPALDGLDIRLKSVEEPRTAVANQRTFTLQKTITNGLAVYVGSVDANGLPSKTVARLPREAWTALSATQVQLAEPLAAKTPVVFVNNEEAGPGESLSVSIEGPTLVYPGSTNTFTIGAFDSFSVYTQVATKGALTRSGKTLTLVLASDEVAGTLDLTVTRDGVAVTRRVAIGAAAIEKPQVVSPVSGATGVGFEPDLSIAPFVVYPAGYDTLRKTRWQVALDAAFTQFVYNAESTTNLAAINLGAVGVRLEPSKQYFARAQEVGDTLTSAWSDAVSFNTAAVYIRRPSITAPLDGQTKVSSGIYFKSDEFSVYGGADQHVGSRWQYSYTADFSSIALDSGWDANQLTAFAPPARLAKKKDHYVRVKYKGKALGESDWSPVIRFTTADRLKGNSTMLSGGGPLRGRAASAVLDGILYVLGGAVSSASFTSAFWAYNPASDTWVQKAALPAFSNDAAGNIGGALFVYKGKIYSWRGQYLSNGSGYRNMNLAEYNPSTNTWLKYDSWLDGVTSLSNDSVVYGDKAYYYEGSLYTYDMVSKVRSYISHPQGYSSLSGSTAVVIDGKFYLLGGAAYNADYGVFLWCFNPVDGTWLKKADAPSAMNNHRAAVVDGKMYTVTSSGVLHVYDPANDAWETIGAIISPRNSHIMQAIGDFLYVHGGHAYINSAYVYYNDLYRVD